MKPDIIDQLFSQYYNEALLYSISLCRNRTVAEDIVSNAFFKALSMSDDSIRDFKPWLLTVCRNEFISICRRERRFTGEEIPENLTDDREEVIEAIIRREEYRSLYRAIDLLPDTQKEAVMLFYFSGLPIKNISEIIQFEVKSKSIGFVTVTDVVVSNDFSHAKVYVTFLGQGNVNSRLEALERTKGFIRSSLARKMDIRKVPELHFIVDDSFEKARKIDESLKREEEALKKIIKD